MSTKVYFVSNDDAAHRPAGALVYLERLSRGDPPVHGNWHIFEYYGPLEWVWGDHPRWIARFDRLERPDPAYESSRYSYILHFEDGTTGIAKVRDINAALAAIGYRFDLDPPI